MRPDKAFVTYKSWKQQV